MLTQDVTTQIKRIQTSAPLQKELVVFSRAVKTYQKGLFKMKMSWSKQTKASIIFFTALIKLYCLYLDYLDGECFVDNADRILPFEARNDNQMTIKLCKQLCFEDNNYVYAGVQYRSSCFCGNNKPNTPAPKSECSMTCSGDNTKMCGGSWKMNVYQKPAALGTEIKMKCEDVDGEGVFLYKIGDDDMLSDNDEMFEDKLLTKIRSYSSGKRNM